jgi:hypothetical protein
MNTFENSPERVINVRQGEKGSALIIALFVLALMGAFVALALTRTATEAAAVGNEAAEARTFYLAQGSLETMTRNFNKVFEVKLNPLNSDLDAVRNGVVAGLPAGCSAPVQEVDQTDNKSTTKVLSGGPYTGLYSIQDNWRLRTTMTCFQGTQVQLTRNILNNRIPIFQFGIFYDDDLELFRPPLFSFGGRVHSNGNFFISPGTEGVYFDSRVTAHKFIVTQTWRNGFTGDMGNNQTWIKNASGVNKQLLPGEGSVLNGMPNVFAGDPDMPASARNLNWAAQSAKFDGNLQSEVKELKLPLKVGADIDLIEMIKRGKKVPDANGGDLMNNNGTLEAVTAATVDNDIMRAERFANKTGIRVSLADSKAKLPGCASGVGTSAVAGRCGVRLDGNYDGLGTDPNPVAAVLEQRSRGYILPAMTDGYQGTRVNGERLNTAAGQVWIKVETVDTDVVTGAILTKDITQEILSLGVTEESTGTNSTVNIVGYSGSHSDNGTVTSPSVNITSAGTKTPSTYPDSRSVIKLQRFDVPGPGIPGGTNVLYSFASAHNVVRRFSGADAAKVAAGCKVGCTTRNTDPDGFTTTSPENYGHLKLATVNGNSGEAVVAFPIEMFDTREGEHYDEASNTYYTDLNKLTRNGVMSMVDIDVANLRRFLRGDFDGLFPTGTPFTAVNGGVSLRSTNIPSKGGWVFYVSDRRGDEDFDGEFDMEDIYGGGKGNDGVIQLGEDLQHAGTYGYGILNRSYGTEAEKYNTNTIYPDAAAINDHRYYRRGIRLINGTTIPGVYDPSVAANTKGFSFASENGVYVLNNYNATGVTSVPATGNTPFDNYRPATTSSLDIPASIVADAVTILSNAWEDGQSFYKPYDKSSWRQAAETTIRFAMISGDTIASKENTPNQGGISPRLNGGVHNFKRFLEHWTGDNLNYSGSLINLFNSHNNNGSFKCCNTVYDPPRRNWVFDSTFLDPGRLPPGTPYFQYVQTTGFQRNNS